MICVLNERDYCSRHGKIHRGLEKMYCLDDSPRGEMFRAHLDAVARKGVVAGVSSESPPSLLRKAGNLTAAVVKHVAAGMPKAENAAERLAICQGCEFFADPNCRKCGCNMAIKTAMGLEKCPVGKW